jgi:two-component system chemotaxis sensor kinase CheA
VVKPVAPILQGISYYAGNTILGDGGVVMILDPNGIAGEIGHQSAQVPDRAPEAMRSNEALKRLLVFRSGDDDFKAIPLELLARLERFDLTKVEVSQGRHMIQYRGHLMPLVSCGDPEALTEGTSSKPTLVFTDQHYSMGLVVDEIVDIVEDQLNIEVTSEGDGLLGSAIIEGRATDVIDIGYYLTKAFPDWFASATSYCGLSNAKDQSLLLVDDSLFFRNLITPILVAAGFQVRSVEAPAEALGLRDTGHHFDAIVSDIEMPGMDGFEFAKKVRASGPWRETPMIALSSYATEADFERGRASGFTDYVAKFDRDGLVHSLARLLGGPPISADGVQTEAIIPALGGSHDDLPAEQHSQ